MARRARPHLKALPRDLRDALYKTRKLTTTGALNKLTRMGLKPVTPLNTIRRLATSESKRYGVPIRITKYMGDSAVARHKIVGLTTTTSNIKTGKGKISIKLHPILKYWSKTDVKDAIKHELDHAKVAKRVLQGKWVRLQ